MTNFFRRTLIIVTVSCIISSSSIALKTKSSLFGRVEGQDIRKSCKMRNFAKYYFQMHPSCSIYGQWIRYIDCI